MRGRIWAIVVLCGVLAAPWCTNAAPVKYNVAFTADSALGGGPNGTGSLFWDSAQGVITDFYWSFGNGAFVGGMGNAFGTANIFGGTFGQFVFEMLSETDVFAPVDCSNACAVMGANVPIGVGPFDSYLFYVLGESSSGGAQYRFATYDFVAGGFAAVSLATTVPEPGSVLLLSSALACLGLMRRRAHGPDARDGVH